MIDQLQIIKDDKICTRIQIAALSQFIITFIIHLITHAVTLKVGGISGCIALIGFLMTRDNGT